MYDVPRHLDREQRLRAASEAAWRVLARDGLAELSVRKVAAEAGLPPSSLRYVLPTQTALKQRATAMVGERILQRAAAVATDGPDAARSLLLTLLPLDEERRMEMEVFLSLGTAAMTDSSLREVNRQAQRAVRQVCENALNALGHRAADERTEVARLHALVDGLALHVIRQAADEDSAWAVEVLELHLSALSTLR